MGIKSFYDKLSEKGGKVVKYPQVFYFGSEIMSRTEVLNSWFFPSTVRKNGMIFPAPLEALEKYRDLKEDWLKNHPDYPLEEPVISLAPGEEEGKEGYFVRTEIMYVQKRDGTKEK